MMEPTAPRKAATVRVLAPEEQWCDFVIHPQSFTICWNVGHLNFWPEPGYPVEFQVKEEPVRYWPVPNLKGARLADCGRCQKTGIVPKTLQDAARYIPYATTVLDEATGQMVMTLSMSPLAAYRLPDGTGEDEIERG